MTDANQLISAWRTVNTGSNPVGATTRRCVNGLLQHVGHFAVEEPEKGHGHGGRSKLARIAIGLVVLAILMSLVLWWLFWPCSDLSAGSLACPW